MDAETAVHRWAATWSRAWTQRDAEDIAELYADTVVYRSPAFGPPDLGLVGVRRYLNEQVPAGEDLECRPASRSSRATGPRSNGGPAGPSKAGTSGSRE